MSMMAPRFVKSEASGPSSVDSQNELIYNPWSIQSLFHGNIMLSKKDMLHQAFTITSWTAYLHPALHSLLLMRLDMTLLPFVAVALYNATNDLNSHTKTSWLILNYLCEIYLRDDTYRANTCSRGCADPRSKIIRRAEPQHQTLKIQQLNP
ncbi:hypothetical protein GQ43DRAFT_210983 [Delitschia confertaspora ATCC 74209]|uniref:Uncharacterized protein n=1 Tax=Delitschia confertaspora ATCC 74209 TaxID=1513339 RepID=A0A9P4JVB4_9PLEO|nr:hypothetical protein GQ43DRAFT_210983 [Delitschia confertaspora ATCC 74209]